MCDFFVFDLVSLRQCLWMLRHTVLSSGSDLRGVLSRSWAAQPMQVLPGRVCGSPEWKRHAQVGYSVYDLRITVSCRLTRLTLTWHHQGAPMAASCQGFPRTKVHVTELRNRLLGKSLICLHHICCVSLGWNQNGLFIIASYLSYYYYYINLRYCQVPHCGTIDGICSSYIMDHYFNNIHNTLESLWFRWDPGQITAQLPLLCYDLTFTFLVLRGVTEGVTLLLLALQTGLLDMQALQRTFLLSIILFIVVTSTLQSMIEITDPIILALGASRNR